nr:hypothetical protein [Tanacetum cinerariifolium]
MQHFWYTIKKVQDTDSYEFLLANKKCTVNVEVFRTILNICPRVEGEDFTDVLDDEVALTFLIDLGYKGLLNRHTNMFVDSYALAVENYGCIINKCLFGKTASNDKLRKSRIDIFWGMFNKDNIPPKKSRGKGSKGKKTVEESQETVNVSEESEPESEPNKKKTSYKRKVKKKVTLSADDLSLVILIGKSSKSVVIQDTPSTPNSKPNTLKTKLIGAPSLTPQEQEAADIMQALKE